MKKMVFGLLVSLISTTVSANIRLPAVLGSNMVLQQQSDVKLWGWSDADERIVITTSWNNHSDTVRGTRDADWQITVQTPAAGGPYIITFKGRNTIILDNIMIGEVWVCSGQSNMEWSNYNTSQDIKDEIPKAYNPNIRLFRITRATDQYPQSDCVGQWGVCDSNTLKGFSAIGYFFGKKLNANLNIPIGLITTAWGGTPVEVWTPADVVNNDPVLKEIAGKQVPTKWWPYLPGKTYNAMIAPLTNFPIAGAIWYQGEANTVWPDNYSQQLNTMIDAWRNAWKKEFPFYYVQIAPFTYGEKRPSGFLIQEQQARSMTHSKVGMVVITDLVDDTADIHPHDKHDVGLRLANYALGDTYKQSGIVYKSPVYKSMIVQKGKVYIDFDNAPNGLVSKDKMIREVMIAGNDKVFYPAQASIEKDKLVVWNKDVKEPVAVRFAFRNAAIGNLFSKEGLPVTPFRTDNWEFPAN